MADLFLNVLNASVAATWVVLAVVAARFLLRRAPRSLVCALWILVGLRLVCNGLFEFPFSLIPSAEIIPPQSLYDLAPTIDSGVELIDRVVNPVYTESLRTDGFSSVNPLQVWLAIFANLWILGMGAMLIWAAASWFRVHRQVRESIPAGDGIFLCDRIESPFLFGLFRPKIYLPPELSAETMEHVIAHERAHLARRDHWWKPIAFLLLAVNWFNPAMWLAYCLLCRDIELACDERVIRDLGTDGKKAYSSALLNCSIPRRHIAACPLAFGEVGVKQRVRSVLHYQKPAFWVVLTAVVLSAILAVSALTDPVSEPAKSSHKTFTTEGYTFGVDLPTGWEAVPIDGSNYFGFRFRSSEMDDGWISVIYWPDWLEMPKYSGSVKEVTFPSGMAGTVYYLTDSDEQDNIWHMIHFYSAFSYLSIEKPKDSHWSAEYHKEALDIIGSITLTPFEPLIAQDPLGITLSVENVTPSGLTLVCSQEGGNQFWREIITGSPWTLERWTNGTWVSALPEDTVWTTVALVIPQGDFIEWSINWEPIIGKLEPGQYRIGKSFWGHPWPDDIKSTTHATEQTYYVEFTIE